MRNQSGQPIIPEGQQTPPMTPDASAQAAEAHESVVQSNQAQRIVGKSKTHESAELHVSGVATYVDDFAEPSGCLHLAVVAANAAKGELLSLDLDAVSQSEGVVGVFTHGDIPGLDDVAPVFKGDPLLASTHISYYGQPVAVVAAKSFRLAQQAAQKASMQITAQVPELDPIEALMKGHTVRPSHTMARNESAPSDAPEDVKQAIDQAMAKGPLWLRGHLSVGGQEHFYLEGQVALAWPTDEGGVHVVSSTQHPSEIQKLVAEVLEVPFRKITVEMRRMGGAFGGKESQAAQWACLAALVAAKTGHAAKLRLPRMQDMMMTGKRHPFIHQYQLAYDTEGKVLSGSFDIVGNCGHSADLSDAIVDRAMFHADNAYHVPLAFIAGHRAKTDTVSHTAFRGFGGPQGMLAIEAALDEIAGQLGMDPLDVRKANLYQNGQTTPYHQTIEHFGLPSLIEQLEASSDYRARRARIREWNNQQPVLKRGIALTPVKFGISFTLQHLNQAGALIHIYTDGSVSVNHGGTEMGQGLHTKVGQIVAEVLGLSVDQVGVSATRTDKVPNTSPTAASSGTDLNGKAAENAANILKKRLVAYLCDEKQAIADSVSFAEGEVTYLDTNQQSQQLSFVELVNAAYVARVSLSATGYYKTPKIYYDRSKAKGRPFFYFAQGAAVSEVVVDTLTGEYRLEAVDILHDVGKSLNPAIDKGQIVGGFVQGMGWLTTEELVWNDKGVLMTNGPATYKIPTISDVPAHFNVALFDRANEEATVYQSKAVGEPPFMLAISVWSALRDAISSVSGYRRYPQLDTPAIPERVLAAITAVKGE
ncbi:MAG: xanthine dehydrogenase molybdopterin binding subunit [Pontibacterium sp.]